MSRAPEDLDPTAALVAKYLSLGWALTPVPKGTKGPRTYGWNKRDQAITDLHQVRRITAGVGLCHAWSRTWALDVDNFMRAKLYLATHDIDLQGLLDAADAVMISSGRAGRCKLLYRLPDGHPLLVTTQLKDHGLEFRCATRGGLSMQDVLPPSIHPETNRPYLWDLGMAADLSALPEAPPELLALAVAEAARAAPPSVESKEPVGISVKELKVLLSQFDADLGYADWVEIGMALHHETRGGTAGLELWDTWSATSSKYRGISDLEQHYRSFRHDATELVTVRSLMAKVGIATADDFENLEELAPPTRPKFSLLPITDLLALPTPQYFIKGVLDRGELGVLYGEPAAGKSFVALDMMLAIAQGAQWRGHRMRQGRVVYICAEGVTGLSKRLNAYQTFYGGALTGAAFHAITDRPNLLRDDDRMLAKQILDAGGADLIVIDTLAQVTPGANENSSEDMGLAISHAARLARATGAMVLLIHHSGKDKERGARGWSGLKAAVDVELEVLRDGDYRAVKLSKLKEGADQGELPFMLQVVKLGTDDDGDDITSCVIAEASQSPPKRQPKGAKQRQILRLLTTLTDLDEAPITAKALIDAVVADTPLDANSAKRDTRHQVASRTLEDMVEAGFIARENGFVRAV